METATNVLPQTGESGLRPVSTFAPTRSQSLLLQAYERGEDMTTIKGFCDAAGVTTPIYYSMLNNPEAAVWWREQTAERAQRHAPAVYEAMAAAAKRGDTAAMKLFMERWDTGYAPRSRQDQLVRAEVTSIPEYEIAHVEHEGGGMLPGADVPALPAPGGDDEH